LGVPRYVSVAIRETPLVVLTFGVALTALSHAPTGVHEGVSVTVQEAPVEVRPPSAADRRLFIAFTVAAIGGQAAPFAAPMAAGTVHVTVTDTGPRGELHPMALGPAGVVVAVPVDATDLHPPVATIVRPHTGRDRVHATTADAALAVTAPLLLGARLGLDAFAEKAALVL